jgi:hypothetical protein
MASDIAGTRLASMKKYLEAVLDRSKLSPVDNIVLDPSGLPKRELPSGKLMDLYHVYSARCLIGRLAFVVSMQSIRST